MVTQSIFGMQVAVTSEMFMPGDMEFQSDHDAHPGSGA